MNEKCKLKVEAGKRYLMRNNDVTGEIYELKDYYISRS
jgi:hypothetical protein